MTSPDEQMMTFGDGTKISAGEYAKTTTVTISAITDQLAAPIDNWADTLDFYHSRLKAVMATVPAAVGNQEPGLTFLNGDPKHLVCGVAQGFNQAWGQASTGMTNLTNGMRSLSGDPQSGLWAAADKYYKAEQANLSSVGGMQATLPPGLAAKLNSGWQPGPDPSKQT